jgi:hypothetical protein
VPRLPEETLIRPIRAASIAERVVPPPGPGRYFSTWGPYDCPILGPDNPSALGVADAPDSVWPIAIACPRGPVKSVRGSGKGLTAQD